MNGRFAIRPQFDQALPFSDGFAAVYHSGKWGFVDHHGSFVIPPRYPVETTDNPHWNINPRGYKEGFALVEWFPFCLSFINKQGERAFNSKELQHLNFEEVHSFHNGFAFVPFQEWNKWNGYGYIDLRGNVLAKGFSAYSGDFSEGLAKVGVSRGMLPKDGFPKD